MDLRANAQGAAASQAGATRWPQQAARVSRIAARECVRFGHSSYIDKPAQEVPRRVKKSGVFAEILLYKRLHAGGAVLLHLLREVAVTIQSKGGGGVAQVSLDGLNIITGADRIHSVGVAQIVEAYSGEAGGGNQRAEPLIDAVLFQRPPISFVKTRL